MFINYIHNFRAIAIIIILVCHSIVFSWWPGSLFVTRALTFTFMNGSVLFVFISGFLFQHLLVKYSGYDNYLKNKFKNILLPYLICSVPLIVSLFLLKRFDPQTYHYYKLPALITGLAPDLSGYVIKVLWCLATGFHGIAYWYIPMIALIFLMAPLFVFFDRNRYCYYSLPFLLILPVVIKRPNLLFYPDLINTIHSVCYFLPIYVTGMWFSRNKETIFHYMEKYKYFALFLLIAISVYQPFYYKTLAEYQTKPDILFIHKMVLCFVLIFYLKKYDSHISKKLAYIAANSFGLFFMHVYGLFIIQTILYLNFPSMVVSAPPPHGVLWITLRLVSIFAISFALVWCIKKVAKSKSRYIIGS